ncbi:melanopsin-like isoform X2 [Montipora foliosa]|uniref:melanopsin-like isoform X2 n=1 Tax=Montipora foliosa TaxID=591990 RepID=UPI0035F2140D
MVRNSSSMTDMAASPRNTSNKDIGALGDPLGRGDIEIWFLVILAVLICLTSFLGNSLVIYTIHKDTRLNTITNVLIENLAYSDIFMAIFHMPFWIVSLRFGKWVFGHVACEVAGVTQLIFGIVSLLTMTAIAIHRYLKVCRPRLYTKFFSNRKATYVIVFCCWMLSIALNTPQLYGWGNIAFHKFFTDCTCEWANPDISYIIFLGAMTIFTPATIIFGCYYVIYKTVRASARRVQGHFDLPNLGKSEDKSDAKVLNTSLVVVCVYIACWTPLSVIGFMEAFGLQSPRLAYFISYAGAYCSSMTNPFIYGIMSPQFKRAFSTILRLK